ncbi:MAG: alpha/beta fold hydrolase [Actinobacteria bacterium]|nr:MAG: alpha/beta fold hydrolase [Actinomycetota bacterium]
MTLVALVVSPLLGPFTWSRVAREMKRAGIEAVVASPQDSSDGPPWWEQHAASVASVIRESSQAGPFVLVGHSGAGPLLPAIAAAAERPAAAYLFVDAGIPGEGGTRIEAMRREDPEFAAELISALQRGERFPAWTLEDLEEVLPGEDDRRRLLREMRPRGLEFFTERIPTSAEWPDAPCGYIRLSPAYEVPASRAARLGWPVRRLEGGHFHMLVDPMTTAGTLLGVLADLEAGPA